MKVCNHCKQELEISNFRYRKKRNCLDYYYQSICRSCERLKEKKNYYIDHNKSKEKLRQKMRYHLYKITETQYQTLVERQDNLCAICNTNTPGGRGNWHVDHDHQTGKVRGLLCHCCNTGLGLFKDNPDLLLKAKEYLNGSK